MPDAFLSHRQMYPEQYKHPLCGQSVRVVIEGVELARGVVERVVGSRFGEIAMLKGYGSEGWAVEQCQVIPKCKNPR